MTLLDRKLLFVTGKGGVGKTTVAAALAVRAARLGKRVLLCEVDGRSDSSAMFETGDLRFKARVLDDNVWGMTLTTEESLREYLKLHLRLPIAAPLGPLARAFDFVATAAPGVKEILTIGKVAWEVKNRTHDLVIVDAPATGHVLGQLRAPKVIGDLVAAGPVNREIRWMMDILDDSARTAAVVVTTADELPVIETLELLDKLEDERVVAPLAVIANRVAPPVVDDADLDLLGRLAEPAAADVLDQARPGASAVLSLAALAAEHHRGQLDTLARLREQTHVEVLELPELFVRASGRRAVVRLAEALAAQGVGT